MNLFCAYRKILYLCEKQRKRMKQIILWVGALVVGTILGLMQVGAIDAVANFVATVYTRLFQLLAVPTIVLAVTTTLASLGKGQGAGRIFRYTITYTLLTTIVAAAVGLMLFVVIAPGTLPAVSELAVDSQLSTMNTQLSYSDHILSIILPIYTIIDMIETAVNVWSDSCVCAMTNHDLKDSSL